MEHVTVRPQTQLLNVIKVQEKTQPYGKCDRCIDLMVNAMDRISLNPDQESYYFSDLEKAVKQTAMESHCEGCGFMNIDFSHK